MYVCACVQNTFSKTYWVYYLCVGLVYICVSLYSLVWTAYLSYATGYYAFSEPSIYYGYYYHCMSE